MRNNRMIELDPEKLKKELERRGSSMQDAAVCIGYSRGYFAHMQSKARATNGAFMLPERVLMLLYEKLNIRREAIEVKKPEPETPPRTEHFDGKLLYDTIYKAVYTAVHDALNG